MDKRTRAYVAGAGIVAIFLLVQLGALALVRPYHAAGLQAVENPKNPTNSLVYVGAILLATAGMLLAMRLEVEGLIRAFVIFSGAYLSLYVFQVVIPPVVTVGGQNALALAAAGLLGVALYVHPEWYVIDAAGVVMGASAAGLFGISFGLLPALVLLVVLAIYDAISVYGTEHMLTLASGVLELRIPIVLVVPLSLSYSFLDAELPDPTESESEDDAASAADGGDEHAVTEAEGGDASAVTDAEEDSDGDDGETEPATPLDRGALFIGLGDAVIPAVLVASAAFFAPAGVGTVAGVALPAMTAMAGTLVGLLGLLWMVMQGRAHAGLPVLNGGTIGGYLLGALASGVGVVQALGLAPYL